MMRILMMHENENGENENDDGDDARGVLYKTE